MLATNNVINSFSAPIFNNLDFLWLLLNSNPWSGFLELVSQPILIIGRTAPSTDGYLTALYYYPVSGLLHIGFALLVASRFHKNRSQLIRPVFILASMLFLISINYVWLAGCCGAAPGWTLDTIFLNYALSTQGYPRMGMEFYERVYGWSQPMQISFMILACGLLWRTSSKK